MTPDEIALLFPYLPPEALQVFVDNWVQDGDERAWAAVRNDQRYGEWFPGNIRDDGTVRYEEDMFMAVWESYEDTIYALDINPDLMRDEIARAIAGNKSPLEFSQDVDRIIKDVINAPAAVRQYYGAFFGDDDVTNRDLIAFALKPSMPDDIFNRRITMAQIGGEGGKRGIKVDKTFARHLFNEGVDQQQAAGFFGVAESALPTLSALAARHADPDDSFDLEELSQALITDDAGQLARIQRLTSQEESLFTDPGASLKFASTDAGGGKTLVTGLGDL